MTGRINPFGKVSTGQRLIIPAAAYNSFIDAANDFKLRQTGMSAGLASLFRRDVGAALVRNSSGSDIEAGGVVGIIGAAIESADNFGSFYTNPVLDGDTPVGGTDDYRFAILLEPAGSGRIVRAAFCGLVAARIDITATTISEGHQFATIEDGETDHLVTAKSGYARIIFAPSGTGVKNCYIILGAVPTFTELEMVTDVLENGDTDSLDKITRSVKVIDDPGEDTQSIIIEIDDCEGGGGGADVDGGAL